MSQTAQRKLTPEQYLAMERRAEQRSEYFNGETFLLAGASRAHNRISTNIVAALDGLLADRDCDVYAGDMRVLVSRTGLFTYPDIVVACGKQEFSDSLDDVLLNPVVIFEVLSPTTEAYDRGRKFEHYQQVESLAEYVLVTQDAPRVEHFVRRQDSWRYVDLRGQESTLELETLGCGLKLSRVFRRVPFGPVRLR